MSDHQQQNEPASTESVSAYKDDTEDSSAPPGAKPNETEAEGVIEAATVEQAEDEDSKQPATTARTERNDNGNEGEGTSSSYFSYPFHVDSTGNESQNNDREYGFDEVPKLFAGQLPKSMDENAVREEKPCV